MKFNNAIHLTFNICKLFVNTIPKKKKWSIERLLRFFKNVSFETILTRDIIRDTRD